MKKPNVKCFICDKGVFRYPYQIKLYKKFFCSRSCSNIYHIERIRKGKLGFKKGHKINLGAKRQPHTEEARKKMSIARKNYFKNNPHRVEEIKKWATGRKQSKETIEKRVSKLRGVERPKHIKKILRENIRRGSDSHFWKGGISTDAYRLRRCAKYTQWRKAVYKRDNYTCLNCGKRGNVHAHHIISFSFIIRNLKKKFPNENLYDVGIRENDLWDINNGETLCVKCHTETDDYGVNDFN